MPMMAQALPVFVFAKGIGRTAGDTMVWDVSFKENKLLVNGTDLSAMAGMGASPSPPAPAPTPAPAPARPNQVRPNNAPQNNGPQKR